jgi:hypothetical protein
MRSCTRGRDGRSVRDLRDVAVTRHEVLIDATLIRAVLLPASMKLLGEADWYLPRWLEWLPTLSHEQAERVDAAPGLSLAA